VVHDTGTNMGPTLSGQNVNGKRPNLAIDSDFRQVTATVEPVQGNSLGVIVLLSRSTIAFY